MAFVREKRVKGYTYYSIVEGNRHIHHIGKNKPTPEQVETLSRRLGIRVFPYGKQIERGKL